MAPVSLRVNPDVDAGTHPYISTGLKDNKFGIPVDEAFEVYRQAATMENVRIAGLDCHIGSQLTELSPFLDALDRLLALLERLRDIGIEVEHLDLGGGLGVPYQDENPPQPFDYATSLLERLSRWPGSERLTLLFEPGRSIAANAGVLLTRVEFLKPGETRNFAIVDAAMNDLIRPALYQPGRRFCRSIPVRHERRTPTTLSARSARPATSSARSAALASPPAICWRYAPPAPTVLSWPRTTTAARVRRR